MRKILFVSTITFLFIGLASMKAQFNAGVNLGMFHPLEEGAKTQLGFNVSGKYSFSEKMRLGANIGYYSKSQTEFGTKISSFSMPITALVEYKFTSGDLSPYIGADIGSYRLGAKSDNLTVSENYFGIAPVFGVDYSLSEKLLLNGNMKLHYILSEGESTSVFGLNVGVAYKF